MLDTEAIERFYRLIQEAEQEWNIKHAGKVNISERINITMSEPQGKPFLAGVPEHGGEVSIPPVSDYNIWLVICSQCRGHVYGELDMTRKSSCKCGKCIIFTDPGDEQTKAGALVVHLGCSGEVYCKAEAREKMGEGIVQKVKS